LKGLHHVEDRQSQLSDAEVLVVLVINVLLFVLAFKVENGLRTSLIWVIIGFLFFLVIIVILLAILRPEALHGLRPQAVDSRPSKDGAEIKAKIEEIALESSVNSEYIDSKLIRFIPPLNPTQFKIIRIPDEHPSPYYNYQFAPMGMLILYNIPFFLLPVIDSRGASIGHQVIDLQPGILNEPRSWNFTEAINNVKAIHVLISSGHAWRMHEEVQFLYRRVGYIRLKFSDGTEQRTDLILGKHLREWAFGNNPNLVTEIDNDWLMPAWLSHDSTKRIDLLTIPISGPLKTLANIEIVADFEIAHPDKHFKSPSIIVSAITVERWVSS
jgi:hypothetical protein